MEAALSKKYDVFLSHSKSDIAAVEQVARELAAAGLKPFLDKWHLVPGEPWQEALECALDDSKCCVVFLGPQGLGPWENEELRVALDARVRDNHYRVIPVLLPGSHTENSSTLPTFLRRLTWVDLRAGLKDENGLQGLIAGIRGNQPIPFGLDAAAGTEITIKINDYYKPEIIALTRDVFALAKDFVVPQGTTIKLVNADYIRLKECIRSQNRAVEDIKIVKQQLAALHLADVMVARAEKWCAFILHEMSRLYGINAAIECCRRFLELRLCEIITVLHHYQLAKGAVFSGFEGYDDREEETLIEFIYGENTFAEIKLAQCGPHYPGKEYTKVYLPLTRIENDGHGHLIANLWEEAEHIPPDIWESYVIPQCAARGSAGQLETMLWRPEGICYVAEGEVWRKGQSVQYTAKKLGSVTFLIK